MGYNRVEFTVTDFSGKEKMEAHPCIAGPHSCVVVVLDEYLPRGRGRSKARHVNIRFHLNPGPAIALGALLTQWGIEAKEARDANAS